MIRYLQLLSLLLSAAIIAIAIVISVRLKHTTAELAILMAAELVSTFMALPLLIPRAPVLKLSSFIFIFASFLSLASGMAWTHSELVSLSTTQNHTKKLKLALFQLFIVSQFLKGLVSWHWSVHFHRAHALHQHPGTPESLSDEESHKTVKLESRNCSDNTVFHSLQDPVTLSQPQNLINKDSLQTLVPNHSLLNVYKVRNGSAYDLLPAHDKARDLSHDLSQNSSLVNLIIHPVDNIDCHQYHGKDSNLIQREKSMLANLSNSLLPPHLQKGESDIILFRKQSQEEPEHVPVVTESIPRVPTNYTHEWLNFSTTITTITEKEDNSTHNFISLQDWEQNKMDWEQQRGAPRPGIMRAASNMTLTILETSNEDMTMSFPEEEGKPTDLQDDLLNDSQNDSLRASQNGMQNDHVTHLFETPRKQKSDSSYPPSIDSLSISSEDFKLVQLSMAEAQPVQALFTEADLRAKTPSPRKSLSISRSRSRTHSFSKSVRSKSSSPIKKFFSTSISESHHFHHKTTSSWGSIAAASQPSSHHRHSRSMFNLELSSKLKFLHQLSAAQTSAHHQHPMTPRKAKSLSPVKRDHVGTPARQLDTVEPGNDSSSTPLSDSASPCPSGGFGEYDREKWRRIKLKLKSVENEQDEEIASEGEANEEEKAIRKASGDIYIF